MATIDGTSGTETLNGTSGDDLFRLHGGTDTVNGNGGIDTIDLEYSPNAVNVDLTQGTMTGWGTATLNGITQIYGSWFGGTLKGNASTTYIAAPGGDTTIIGGDSSSTLVAGTGNDTITGGAGNDDIVSGTGNNHFDGGGGYNGVDYRAEQGSVTVDLYAGGWHPGGMDTLANIVNIYGSDYASVLKGDYQDNIIIGGAGNDTLEGREGNDTLTGGGGADTFVFAPGTGHSVVTDFHASDNDVLDLSAFGIHNNSQLQAVASQQGSNVLLSLSGGSTVTLDNTTLADLGGATTTGSGHASDYNGDGYADILWRDSDGHTAVWSSQGGSLSGRVDLGIVPTDWTMQGSGDFNGDGKMDILWRQAGGDLALWNSNGGGGVSFTGQDLGVVPTDWKVQGVADFNGDGASDILWRDSGGHTAVWSSQSGALSGRTDLGIVPSSWSVQATGDFNGDGKADILWRNSDGDLAVWNSQSGGGVSFVGQDLGVVPADWHVQPFAADFNGDGKADILWRNNNGDVVVWNSQAGAGVSFSGTDLGIVPTGWQIQGAADYNNDGSADILWRAANGDAAIWSSQSGSLSGRQDLGIVPTNWHILSDWHMA